MSVKRKVLKKRRFFYDIAIYQCHFIMVSVDINRNSIGIMMYHTENEDTNYDYEDVIETLRQIYSSYHISSIIDLSKEQNINIFKQQFKECYEWFGWNSRPHHLMMLSMMLAYLDMYKTLPSTKMLMRWSYQLRFQSNSSTQTFIDTLSASKCSHLVKPLLKYYRSFTRSNCHVDVAALNEKSGEDIEKTKVRFPLQIMQSYTGLDVIDDDLMNDKGLPSEESINERLAKTTGELTNQGLSQQLVFQIKNIISVAQLSQKQEYRDELILRDELRRHFPFLNNLKQGTLPRDATITKYVGKIIRGKDNVVLKDKPCITLDYPFKNGLNMNLLDYIEKYEQNINPRIIEYYRHFENKDTRQREEYQRYIESSLTGKTTINTPYFDHRGFATSSYITLTHGGGHGGIVNHIHGRRLDNINDEKFLRDFETMSVKNNVSTVDMKDTIYVDFHSYYATLNIMLGTYHDGKNDNFKSIWQKRRDLKNKLTSELKEKDAKTYDAIDRQQKVLKRVLTSATGASNQHKPKSDLPLDNATLSMRMIGNLLIYVLGQRFSNAGGLVVFTNTDGLCIANISMEKAKTVLYHFYNTYGLDVEPIKLERIISKNANERITKKLNQVTGKYDYEISGRLNRALGSRINLSTKIDYPRVCGKAVLNYIETKPMWLIEPIDKNYLKELLKCQLNHFKPIDWTITLKGHNERTFYLEDSDGYAINDAFINGTIVDSQRSSILFDTRQVKLTDTNRIIMSRKGRRITQLVKGQQQKISELTSQNVEVLNSKKALNNVKRHLQNIDIDAYYMWAYHMLNGWHQRMFIPEIDNKDKDLVKQITIDDLD